ncbi:uncharacterized protein LOC132725989 [Ruditapes philippinarum]|uniref:uncharacterized protein LOC132725989 n=1 Tax=Ruditapes philippinarum TaxID=129788 RepID=UPI00295AB728|nr:uncharacterized protein LOC132725989 [Ruditapes philippinarum]
MQSNNSIRKERSHFAYQKTLLIVLISTTVAELISLWLLAGHWRQLRSDIIAPKESIVCLPLRTLITVEDDRHQCPDGLKEKANETKETKLCCGSMSIVLNKVSAKIVKDKYNDNAFPEYTSLDMTAFNCSEKKTVPLEANLVGYYG